MLTRWTDGRGRAGEQGAPPTRGKPIRESWRSSQEKNSRGRFLKTSGGLTDASLILSARVKFDGKSAILLTTCSLSLFHPSSPSPLLPPLLLALPSVSLSHIISCFHSCTYSARYLFSPCVCASASQMLLICTDCTDVRSRLPWRRAQ